MRIVYALVALITAVALLGADVALAGGSSGKSSGKSSSKSSSKSSGKSSGKSSAKSSGKSSRKSSGKSSGKSCKKSRKRRRRRCKDPQPPVPPPPANNPPTATDSSGQLSKVASIVVPAPGLLNSVNDPDGDPITFIAFDNPSTLGAEVYVAQDGSFLYDPRLAPVLQALGPGEVAEDTFTYTVSDGRGGTATATVTFRVVGR